VKIKRFYTNFTVFCLEYSLPKTLDEVTVPIDIKSCDLLLGSLCNFNI